VEPPAIEPIDPLATALLHGYQLRRFEDAQVPGCGRPTACETFGDLARGHLTAAEVQHQHDLPPRRMRQGAEDRVEIVEFGPSARLSQT